MERQITGARGDRQSLKSRVSGQLLAGASPAGACPCPGGADDSRGCHPPGEDTLRGRGRGGSEAGEEAARENQAQGKRAHRISAQRTGDFGVFGQYGSDAEESPPRDVPGRFVAV